MSSGVCSTKIMMGTDFTEMGWDLSLRAPSYRALSMNSIWLQEEKDGDREGSWMKSRSKGLNPMNGDPKGSTKKTIDPILEFSLEGK
ncbi:hypothetical protein GOBAR_DD18660 [Gossypium barbadense]|nr:hypothetical protein GOBAR_DD18660 [Gossypium barbadense]